MLDILQIIIVQMMILVFGLVWSLRTIFTEYPELSPPGIIFFQKVILRIHKCPSLGGQYYTVNSLGTIFCFMLPLDV